jgi:hypothetical protein
MEAGSRQLGRDSKTRERLLILAAAVLLTALLVGGLFEATAHLTQWLLNGGFERYKRLHPWAHIAASMLPAWFVVLAGLAAGTVRHRKQHARLKAHRRTPAL